MLSADIINDIAHEVLRSHPSVPDWMATGHFLVRVDDDLKKKLRHRRDSKKWLSWATTEGRLKMLLDAKRVPLKPMLDESKSVVDGLYEDNKKNSIKINALYNKLLVGYDVVRLDEMTPGISGLSHRPVAGLKDGVIMVVVMPML